MNYISTRGHFEGVSSAYAIKKGLAPDGGLYMPDELPRFTHEDFENICKMSYAERAAFILGRYLTDYTYDELLADCKEAYSNARFGDSPAPIHALGDNIRVLELWHGPTCAFKDMALQIMPRLLSRALVKTGEERTAFILVATSGDTGKAALEGYRDADQTKIMVFYPVDGVSRIQKLQMATQEGSNVEVRAVVGNFDDTQSGVKRIFSDAAAAKKLSDNGYILSSANSINWGRLAPQIVYYISAYCDLVERGDIKIGDEMNVCVPTGNFGNILAAYIAKNCGLPVGRLICASNKNNILTDFFKTGIYDRNRDFYTTMSPSMDILISSNLERLLYMSAGEIDTAAYMKSLSDKGRYEITPGLRESFAEQFTGMFCDENATAERIKATFDEYSYLIDTHTAVGLDCAARYIEETGDKRPMLTVSTASPYKFASSVLKALTGEASADEFENLTTLSSLTKTEIPYPLASLEGKKIRFNPDSPIEAAKMENEVFSAIL